MKIIKQLINTCEDCPYFQYNSYYGMSYDSGYDCGKTCERIINDGELKQYEDAFKEYHKSQNTLFPISRSEKPVNPLSIIPKWCPLDNYWEDDLK